MKLLAKKGTRNATENKMILISEEMLNWVRKYFQSLKNTRKKK